MIRFSKCINYLLVNEYRISSIMASKIEIIKQNAENAKRTIAELKKELSLINDEYNRVRAQHLCEENIKLAKVVEETKKRLVQLEVKNSIKQIPIPNSSDIVCSSALPMEASNNNELVSENTNMKPKKEKKSKEHKEKAEHTSDLPIDIGRLDLRIAKIEHVGRHPDADSLYVLKVDCGDNAKRTVCSGLVKHIQLEELKDRNVMLLCNLKPVKMRGITSEAMVMCASTSDKVEVLEPPENCKPGDLVHCEGYTRQPDSVMNPKKKIFETVAPDLHVNDCLEACYKGIPLKVNSKGTVMSKSMKNCPVK